MRQRNFLIVLLLAFLILAGCESKQPILALTAPKPDLTNTIQPLSKNLNVHVYLDSTLSMKGYVSQTKSTQYMHTIQNLESAITTGWSDPNLKYYKFGASVQPLTGRDHIRAVEPSFYQSGGLSAQTQINKVVSQGSISTPGNLSIIITDLFENDSDLTNLSNLIKERCFKNNIAVGVIGAKSQFAGNIYDVGIRAETFPYASEDGKNETYRPFYIIAFGNQTDVINLFEQLKLKLPYVTKDTFSLFSKHIVNPLATFDESNRTKSTNLNPVENLVKPSNQQIRQLRVLDDTDAKATYSIPIKLVPYTPGFDTKPLEIEITGEDYENGRKVGISDGLSVEPVSMLASKMVMPIKVKPGSMKEGHTYNYRIAAFPAKDSYKFPSWWSQWNLEMGSVVSRTVSKRATIDGGKTQNLSLFMTNLWQANYITHRPKIFDSYVYIVKK